MRAYTRTCLALILMAAAVISAAARGGNPGMWTFAATTAAVVAGAWSADRWRARALRAEQAAVLRARSLPLRPPGDDGSRRP